MSLKSINDTMKTDIENFLRSQSTSEEELDPNGDLFASGILDSLGIANLLLFLENTYGLQIPAEEVTVENFNCLDAVVTYLEGSLEKSQ